MINIVMALALTAPGQYPCEEIQRLINDRITYGGYGGYGTHSSSYATPSYLCPPRAPYVGACYGPAIRYVPVAAMSIAVAEGNHVRDHKTIHKSLDEFKCSLDKLTEAMLSLEKRVGSNEKAMQAGLNALEKKLKANVKKLDERIKPVEEKTKANDEGLKNLTKKLEEQTRAAEIEALKEKLRKVEENEKLKQIEEKFSAGDRLKAIENKLQQVEMFDRKRDETILQFLDQKLDRMQGALKRDIDGVQDQLKKVDGQLREERDGRLRLEDRLKVLEKLPPPPTKNGLPLPGKESLREPREFKDPSVPADKAQVIITLPADARLFLNDQPTLSTGATRTFLTPAIAAGTSFAYTVRIEWVKNAELISHTHQVNFQAGQQARVNFDGSNATLQTVQAR